jgi:GGDEF domain-containing protein
VAVFDRASRLGEAADEIARRAVLDRLTGLYTYEFFAETLENEVGRVSRYGGRCSLVLFDLDRFKEFNDRYGHAAGNDLLERVGAEILRLKRHSDVAARFGGEELAVLVPAPPARPRHWPNASARRWRRSASSITGCRWGRRSRRASRSSRPRAEPGVVLRRGRRRALRREAPRTRPGRHGRRAAIRGRAPAATAAVG